MLMWIPHYPIIMEFNSGLIWIKSELQQLYEIKQYSGQFSSTSIKCGIW